MRAPRPWPPISTTRSALSPCAPSSASPPSSPPPHASSPLADASPFSSVPPNRTLPALLFPPSPGRRPSRFRFPLPASYSSASRPTRDAAPHYSRGHHDKQQVVQNVLIWGYVEHISNAVDLNLPCQVGHNRRKSRYTPKADTSR